MAKKKRQSNKKDVCYDYYVKKKLMSGGLLFLFGLIKYMGYSWEVALMVIGALVFLKGLIMKMK